MHFFLPHSLSPPLSLSLCRLDPIFIVTKLFGVLCTENVCAVPIYCGHRKWNECMTIYCLYDAIVNAITSLFSPFSLACQLKNNGENWPYCLYMQIHMEKYRCVAVTEASSVAKLVVSLFFVSSISRDLLLWLGLSALLKVSCKTIFCCVANTIVNITIRGKKCVFFLVNFRLLIWIMCILYSGLVVFVFFSLRK